MGYSPNANGQSGQGQTFSIFANASGSSIPAVAVVAQGGSNDIVLVDVSNESTVFNIIGLTNGVIPNGGTGAVISDGRFQNIPSGLGLTVGQPLWVGSTPGTLTTTKPQVGFNGFVEEDFIIFVGVVVQNQFNPSNQDIQVSKQIIGQL
jgi:hypothetical protein